MGGFSVSAIGVFRMLSSDEVSPMGWRNTGTWEGYMAKNDYQKIKILHEFNNY